MVQGPSASGKVSEDENMIVVFPIPLNSSKFVYHTWIPPSSTYVLENAMKTLKRRGKVLASRLPDAPGKAGDVKLQRGCRMRIQHDSNEYNSCIFMS